MSSWTIDEDRPLLLSLCDLNRINWAALEEAKALPPGRTVKACSHRIAKMKAMKAEGGTEGVPSTPKKKKAAATPKKSATRKRKKDEYESDELEEEEVKSDDTAKAKKPAGKKQRVDSESESEAKSTDNETIEVGRCQSEVSV